MPQCLCLSPTRELARQTLEVITTMGKFTNITTQLVVPNAIPRGSSVNAQVLVGTPGIAIDLIRRRQLNLSKMKVFVLDEADNMLEAQGLGDQAIRVKKLYLEEFNWYYFLPLSQLKFVNMLKDLYLMLIL